MPYRSGFASVLKCLVFLTAWGLCLYAVMPEPAQAALDSPGRSTGSSSTRIDFNRDIRPILADKCWACHGPDALNKKIKLRLDSEEGALADLGQGRRAIVPNHPEQSQMVRRITAEDKAMRMPPVSSGRSLTKRGIELLVEWIKQGAQWQKHWSFIPPARPPLPQIKNKNWPKKNAIDYFVLERLEREGLQPSPEADRATLIRRASLDLTGLPPTPREVDDFLSDKSPNAYERVVDRLLASPRYGERMAFRWLDAARYADTNGYQLDGERTMWPWRDWVVEAFNRNMPFDQFVVEQLAGDLLPSPTLDQRIATAFNRNHRNNSEDGLIPEEYAVEYVVDRVDTTATIFLGLTMSCARCHNHKNDPFTQREYYQLYAYFNSIPEDGRVPNHGNAPPYIPAPTREQQQQLEQLDREIAQAEKQLASSVKRSRLMQRRWELSLKGSTNQQWFPADDLLLHHALDQTAALKVDESVLEKPKRTQTQTAAGGFKAGGFKDGLPKHVPAPTGQGVEFDGQLFFDAGKTGDFDYRDRLTDFKSKFTISVWFYPESENSGAIVTRTRDESGEKENALPKGKGYGVYFINGKVHFNLIGVWADDSYRVETAEKLPVKQWHHLIASFDGTAPYDKVRIYVNGRKQKLKVNNHRLFRTFSDPNYVLRIGGGGGPEYRFKGMMDDVRIYSTLPDEEMAAILSCADPLESIAAVPQLKRTEGQRLKMLGAWLDKDAPANTHEEWVKLRRLKHQGEKLVASFPTLMVMQELPEPRPAFLLKRGAYDAPAERVERSIPAIFPPMPKEFPNNRLGLARWIVNPDNPLTARVMVNRFWQMLFGAGLVKTAEDFGSQGEPPSHPELLDWLATEFQSNGWDVKAMLKTIVTSATYRQSSKAAPQLLGRDPDNRLLARSPRLRLPAETIRDQALFVSGLLVERLGGPSVKTYQPAGLWKDMVFSNMTNYDQAKDENLWRRSLYTFWKRTITPPTMGVFDASPREFCTVRENRTNTPLQALNLMNDVTYVEAARMLAQRMLTECGGEPEERVAWAFRLVTSRWPDRNERRILINNLNAQLEYFRSNPKETARLLAVGERRNRENLSEVELAAYTSTSSLILNLDEVITKQ